MEATFCLRPAAVNLTPGTRLLLPAAPRSSSRHLLRPGVFRVSFSHALPPARRVVSAAGAAMVVACAVDALYLYTSPPRAPILTAGAARRRSSSSSSISAQYKGGGGGDDVSPGEYELPTDEDSGPTTSSLMGVILLAVQQTVGMEAEKPLTRLVDVILRAVQQTVGTEAEKPLRSLLLHQSSDVRDRRVVSVDDLHYLVFGHDPLTDDGELKERYKKAPSDGWIGPHEKTEAGIALAQLYIGSAEHGKARAVLRAIEISCRPRNDPRIPFLQAISSIMLAIQQVRVVPDDKQLMYEVQGLLKEAKHKWADYEKLGKDGIPTSEPPVPDEDSSNE